MKLILHIGQQKTGSTSLQRFLYDNYDALLKHKILYPRSLGTEHYKQHHIFKYRDNLLDESLKLKEKLESEIKRSNANVVIISDENLFFGIRINKNNIVNFLRSIFDEIEILIYLRRQDLHAPSHYQQSQLGLVTRTFDDWIEHAIDSGYYDYYNVLKSWKDSIPEAKFTIKPLTNLVRKDIRYDISRTLGIKHHTLLFKKSQNLNESVDWSIIPILRCFNLLISEQKDPNRKNTIKEIKSAFIKYGIKISQNDKLTLNKKQYKRFYSYYKNVNKKLVDEFNLLEEDALYFLKIRKESGLSNFPLDKPTILDFNTLNDFIRSKFKPLNIEDALLSIFSKLKKYNLEEEEQAFNYSENSLKNYTAAIVNLYEKNIVKMKGEINVYKPLDITNKSLYFLHIAKCGGTSVRDYLDQLFYQNEFVAGLNPEMLSKYPKEEIKNWKLISGHLDRTVLKYIKPDITITWLRDPVQRYISAYSRLSQLKIENRADFTKNKKAEEIISNFENDNNYFRAENPEFLRNGNLMTKSLGSNFFSYERYTTSGEEKLKEAIRYLTEEVQFFGIMTRIQESMDLLSYTLGQIPHETYLHSNATNSMYKGSYESEKFKTFFKDISDLDLKLWQYSVDLFNERFNRTLHNLWTKFNGYDDRIKPDSNFNDLDYEVIRPKLIKYITNEVQSNDQIILKSELEYTFDMPLHGSGWSRREWFNDLTHYTLRWINQPKAYIYLPLDRSNILECYVHLPHQVTKLKTIYIDNTEVKDLKYISNNNHSKDIQDGQMLYFTIPVSLNPKISFSKIEFEVTSITSPNQLDKNNPDHELKSIAIDWLKITPLQ